jgi:hypothetical protein
VGAASERASRRHCRSLLESAATTDRIPWGAPCWWRDVREDRCCGSNLYAPNLADKEELIDAGITGARFGFLSRVPGAPRYDGVRVGGRW